MRFFLLTFLLAAALPVRPAHGQTAEWHVSAGRESFAFRDTARNSPPVDGSPVRWRGSGPIVTVEYDRTRPLRRHQFELTLSSNGGFVYETSVDVSARPPDDAARFLALRYDYRRYLARTLGIDGLRPAIGVRGIGERRTLHHQYGGDIALTQTDVTGTIGFVAAVQFRRSDRFTAELAWTNGSTLAHGVQRHEAGVVADDASWGAGWLTDLMVQGAVRLTTRLAVAASWGENGEGLLFDHRGYAAERRRFTAGVVYAR